MRKSPSRLLTRKSRLFVVSLILLGLIGFGVSVSSHSGGNDAAQQARPSGALGAFLNLLVPSLTVKMSDQILSDGTEVGKAGPGEKIQYTVTITNGGTDPANNLTLQDTVDANTTFNSGSLNAAPIAVNDTYDTIANTLLEVGVTASGHPAVRVTDAAKDSVFDNDLEFLNDSHSFDTITVNPANGTLTFNTNGTFSYQPNAGFVGTDSFTYRIKDGNGLTDTGVVTINVKASNPTVGANTTIWYVKNDVAGTGTGTSSDPFKTLVQAQTASAAGDTIYVFNGDGTTTGQNTGITLKANQRLVGEGVQLDVPVAVNGGPNPTVLRAAGTKPSISGATGVTVANIGGVSIRGLNIAGTTDAIAASFNAAGGGVTISDNTLTGGTGNAIDATTSATGGADVTINNNTITGAGAEGIDINGAGTGTLTLSIHDNTVTASTNGIDIARTAGSVNVTAFDDNVVTGNTGLIGINISGGGGSVLFDTNPATAAYDTVQGGNTVIGQSGNGVGTAGMVLSNIRGDLNFSDLDIFADSGNALFISGSGGTPNFTSSSGTRVTASTGTPTVSATGGAAVSAADANINLVFSSLTSSGSAASGVSLSRVSGTFSAPSGSSITNASAADFFVDGLSHTGANVNATYGGTITDDVGTLVQIQNVTPTVAATYTFSGAITDGDDGDGNGVSLTGNTNATITFNGGLVLSTGSLPAFTATGGGTVNVCNENPCNPNANGALVNKITTTTGTALNVANTNIGSNRLEFRSINAGTGASGPTNAIILNTTGSSGGLKVTGNGGSCTPATPTCTGGTIQRTGSHAVLLTNTANVEFNLMSINNTGNRGITGSGVSGFILRDSRIFNFDNGTHPSGATVDAMHFTNLSGTVTIQRDTIGPDGQFSLTPFPPLPENKGIVIRNTNAAPLTMNVTGTRFTQISNDGIDAEVTGGTATLTGTLNVDGSTADGANTFEQINGRAITFSAPTDNTSSRTLELTIKNNTFNLVGIGGRWLASARTTVNARYNNNTMTNTTNDAIRSESDASNATLSPKATVNATVSGNTMGGGSIFISNHRQAVQTMTFSSNTNIGGTAAGVGGAGSIGVHTGINVRSDRGSTVNIDVLNNTGTADGSVSFFESALDLQATDNGGGASTICAKITGNTFTQNPDAGKQVISIDPAHAGTSITIEGGSGGSPNTENFLIANNTLNGTVKVAISAPSRVPNGTSANCVTSVLTQNNIEGHNRDYFARTDNIFQGSNDSLFSFLNQRTDFASVTEFMTRLTASSGPTASYTETQRDAGAAPYTLSSTNLPAAEIAPATISFKPEIEEGALALAHGESSPTLGSRLSGFVSAIVDALAPTAHANPAPASAPLQAFDINQNFGTLPAGESLVVVFDVTVNAPPVAQYSNQATVFYTGGPSAGIKTDDDPGTAAAEEPTITPGDRYNTSTALTGTPPSPAFTSDTITFVAVVTPTEGSGLTPNGTVQFKDGAANLGSPVNCAADVDNTCKAQLATTLTAGAHNITAQYLGGTNHDPSTSNTLNYTITACTSDPVVLNTSDGTSPPAGSLREAIINACPGSTITFDTSSGAAFDPANGAQMIQLTSALPDINKNLTITGPGANMVDVRGKIGTIPSPTEFRVFNITSGVTVNISGLTISNGGTVLTGGFSGGGINNAGALTLTEVTVRENQASSSGGGIQNSSTLNLIRSTVSNNTSLTGGGGGIFNSGTLTIRNSTIASNTANAGGNGGGILNNSGLNIVTIESSTIALNSANGTGGGIFNSAGTFNIGNTIVGDNTANTASPDLAGIFTSNGYNLFENPPAGYTPATGDQINVDPKLQTQLSPNGGPTLTLALLDNSPAIDAGNTTLTVDQRNQPREINNPNVTNAAGGDASDIGAYEAPAPTNAPDLDAASDSGVNNDNITNDNTPTFTITGVLNGEEVYLLRDGSVVASGFVSATCSGSPCIQLTDDPAGAAVVPDGTYSYTARRVVAGGLSPQSPALSNVVIDTVAPTINIGAPSPTSANASTSSVTYTVTYGGADSITLATGNITLNKTGTADATVGVSGSGNTTRTVTLSNITGTGTLGISIASGTASDTAGNTAPASGASATFTVDADAPSVSMNSAAPNPTNTSPIPVTVTFSESVTGFTASDITPGNATVNNFAGSGASYTFDLTPSGQGGVTADISAGVATDAAGNSNTAATQFSRTFDSVAPTVSMNSAASDPTNTSPIPVTVTFSESVTGFTDSDITPSNGTVGNFAGSGASYTFDLTPSGQGGVTADISAGVATDAAGNSNTAATQFSRIYDTVAPTVTINQASGQTDPVTNATEINFTVVFNEPVTGFDASDVDLSASTAGGTLVATVTGDDPPNDGTTYNVKVTGMNSSGVVTATINASAAQDAAGNDSAASTSTDNEVTYQQDNSATLEVNSTADTDDGSCDPVGTGNGCTLSEAINAANADFGAETITFNIPTSDAGYDAANNRFTITLLTALPSLMDDVTISGPGANLLTVKRSTAGGTPDFRIFTINGGVTVSISGVTITNGNVSGGAILNGGTLTITNSALSNNRGNNRGGAIYNASGSLTITNSTLSGNTASGGGENLGGAIYSSGSLTITNSTLSGNTVNGGSASLGGAIFNDGGTATITNSTLSGNTVSGGGSNQGGAIFRVSGTVNIRNSIIADNTASDGGPDVFGSFTSQGHNLIGKSDGSTGFTNGANGDQVGTSASPIDPMLGPLANNGGETQTHLLLPGSPAINTGSNALAKDQNGDDLTTDQRGAGFARIINTTVDIGAVEVNYAISATAGASQSAVIGTAFATQLQAKVTESGMPQNGLSVTFTAPASGASGIFQSTGTETVTVSTNASGVATAPTFTANNMAGGPYNVTATLDGTALSATFALTNTKADQTITFGALANKTFGDADFTVSATASSGLPVSFSSTTPSVCSVSGTTVTILAAGTCTVRAAQAGDSNYNAAPNVDQTFTVAKANQTITFNALANKTFGDADFTVSATATSGLTVTFAASGNCTISGSTVSITGAGSCTITASQAGNANYNAAPAVPQSFTIGKAATTTTVTVSNATFDGNPHGATASVTGAGGLNQSLTVTYTGRNATTYGPTTTAPTNAGDYTASASFAENANYTGSSDSEDFQIAKANQTITFGALADKTFGDADFTLSATASSGLSVSFAATGNCTLSGNTVSITGAGSCTITAKQAGNANFNAATDVARTFQIAQAATVTALASSANPSVVGQEVTFTATVTSAAGTPTGTVQFVIDGTNAGAAVALNASGTASFATDSLTGGTHTVAANYSGAADFAASAGTLSGGQQVVAQPVLQFNPSSYTVAESDPYLELVVTRTGDTAPAVTVDYTTQDGTATQRSDYTVALGTLTFAAGETEQHVRVLINQDALAESTESLTVLLSNPTGGAVLGAQSTATIQLTDDADTNVGNTIDEAREFVRQHYRDFLNREADAAGEEFWLQEILSCNQIADATERAICIEVKRQNVSAAFFLSIEFKETGCLVYHFYTVALDRPNNLPGYVEFMRDTQRIQRGVIVNVGNWQAQLEANKQAFAEEMVTRAEFLGLYSLTMTPAQYADALYAHAALTPSAAQRQAVIDEFGGAAQASDTVARARALRRIADSDELHARDVNRAFVLMQYFGYLRRNPNDAPDSNLDGYNFWLAKLESHNGNFISSQMILAFLRSMEYRQRFGQP